MPDLIPHGAFPPRYINGLMVTVEQDSADHIAQRLQVALLTDLGSRVEDPTFGIPDDLMRAPGVDLEALKAALTESEPAAAASIDRVTDPQDLRTERLRILIDEDN